MYDILRELEDGVTSPLAAYMAVNMAIDEMNERSKSLYSIRNQIVKSILATMSKEERAKVFYERTNLTLKNK